jgi:hypothetical protein
LVQAREEKRNEAGVIVKLPRYGVSDMLYAAHPEKLVTLNVYVKLPGLPG